jgi:hypothetical protein
MPTKAGNKALECKPEQGCEFVVTVVVTSLFTPIEDGEPMGTIAPFRGEMQ